MKKILTTSLLSLVAITAILVASAALLSHGLSPVVALAGAIALSAFIGLIMAQILTQRIVGPIARMHKIIQALDNSEVVDLEPFPKNDEISRLGQKLTVMASRNAAVEEANKDALTGLANRRYLMQRLEDMLSDGKTAAVMFLDLDKFKPVNDTHGHEVGDEALMKISEFMSTCVRENDLLARIGGDEFVLAFSGLDATDVLETRAKKVIELASSPFWIGDIRIKLGASIGIAVGPADGTTAEELLNAADEAMYAVKKSGRNGFKFYS